VAVEVEKLKILRESKKKLLEMQEMADLNQKVKV
jgi:hypothetical protein